MGAVCVCGVGGGGGGGGEKKMKKKMLPLGLLLKGRICSIGSKFFPFRIDPFSKGRKQL